MIHILSDDPDGAESLAKLKGELGDADLQQLNTAIFDGQQLAVEHLINACESMPFLAPRRLIIVRGLLSRFETAANASRYAPGGPAGGEDALKDDADESAGVQPKNSNLVRQLAEYCPRLPPTTELVFVEPKTISNKHPLHKALTAAKARFAQTPRLQGDALAAWITRRVRAKDGRLAGGAAALLASFDCEDLQRLDGELDKLVAYAGNEPIDTAAVRQLATAARELNVYKMADAIATGDAAAALGRLHELLADGESPLYLLSMIVRQFRLLVQIKDLQARGQAVDGIAAKLRLPGFAVQRLLRQSRRYPSFERLESVYRQLLAADLAAKSGGRDPVASIELLVADIADSNPSRIAGPSSRSR